MNPVYVKELEDRCDRLTGQWVKTRDELNCAKKAIAVMAESLKELGEDVYPVDDEGRTQTVGAFAEYVINVATEALSHESVKQFLKEEK